MSICTQRAYDEVIEMVSQWTIGSTGAHTRRTGVPGTGFASVARTAAGKYTVTFAKGAPSGKLIDLQVTIWQAVDEESLIPRPSVSTFTAETASAGATVKYETWVIDETAAQTEIPSGAIVTIRATWLKTS